MIGTEQNEAIKGTTTQTIATHEGKNIAKRMERSIIKMIKTFMNIFIHLATAIDLTTGFIVSKSEK